MLTAESILKSSDASKETKKQHQERINKAREKFEEKLTERVKKNLARESARSEMEKALEAKKLQVSEIAETIKELRAQKKTLQGEIREARKVAREVS